MTSVSEALPCLLPLSFLAQYVGPLNTFFSENKTSLLCPCKKVVTWSCKIDISYLHGQKWENSLYLSSVGSESRKLGSLVAHSVHGKDSD